MTKSRMPRLSSTSHVANNPAELKAEESSQIDCTALELESIVWRKLDTLTLPLLTSFYILATLDRTNIANASVAGLQKSLAISHYQFTVALTVTSITLIAAELPSTLLLKYVGPDLMLPAMVVLWGVVSTTQGLVSDYSGLLVCRFFLGLLEGGIAPGIFLYLSFFYPRGKLQFRTAIIYATSSLASTFSGLLAAAIVHIGRRSGRPGWAWIFILEGIFTFVFGVVSFSLLPRSPERARFFTEDEREYIVSALKRAGSVSEDESKDRFSWREVIQAAKSPHLWFLAPVFFFSGATFNGLAYFEPTIVADLGYMGSRAQLMSTPPYAITFVLTLIAAIVSDRHQCRGLTVILFSLLAMIGFTMFYASTSSHVRYVSLFFSVIGTNGTPPALMAWLANNSAPHARRATTIAMAFVMIACGGMLATWLLGFISPAPKYTAATITFVVMSAGMIVFSTANLVYLWRENRLKATRRRMMRMCKEEETGNFGDRSAWFIYSL